MDEYCKENTFFVLYGSKFGGCEMKNIEVACSEHFNRKPAPEIDYLIEDNWTKFLSEIDKLYDAEKFRIHSVKTENGRVLVEIGLTGYKDYIGTNLNEKLGVFEAYGMKAHGSKQACLSDCLGVGAMVITSDDHVMFVTRSHEVAEGRGLHDFPGGHAEPSVSQATGRPNIFRYFFDNKNCAKNADV